MVAMEDVVRESARSAREEPGALRPASVMARIASVSRDSTRVLSRPAEAAAARTSSAMVIVSVTTRLTSASVRTWAICSTELVS